MNDFLVTATFYPLSPEDARGMFYHTRNKYYLSNGFRVTVLSFSAQECYTIEGVNVITLSEYKKNCDKWKYVICHAPDGNTYKFLTENKKHFRHIFFVIHGNEMLNRTKYYTNQFDFVKSDNKKLRWLENIRESIKLLMWRKMFKSVKEESDWVFVSQWMKDEFLKNTKFDSKIIAEKGHVIYNCVGSDFINNTYDFKKKKEYDFITIRGNYDSSKYAIDVVNQLAISNPQYRFLVVGRGHYFEHYKKAQNVELLQRTLSHNEILEYLDASKCALMPTRHDAQGVMMCEMATYGMPMITSDILVCKEVFSGFANVGYINNVDVTNGRPIDLNILLQEFKCCSEKNLTYSMENTCLKEIELFQSFIMGGKRC